MLRRWPVLPARNGSLRCLVISLIAVIVCLYLSAHPSTVTQQLSNDKVIQMSAANNTGELNGKKLEGWTELALQELMSRKEDENQKKLDKIAWFCASEKSLRDIPLPTRIYGIPGFNMSLTLIAKVASTSWVAFLARTQVPQCYSHVKSVVPGYVRLHECVKEVLSRADVDQPMKLLFVRDPWSRLVSVYEDKILKQRFVQADFCYQRWRIDRQPKVKSPDEDEPNLSFSQFVACIIETNNPSDLDPHYRPQYLMHGLCGVHYTHIGSLEDLDNDFIYIMKAAQPQLSMKGIQQLVDAFHGGPRRPWELEDISKKRRKLMSYFTSLNSEQISSLQDIYKWDVLLHSYKPHPV